MKKIRSPFRIFYFWPTITFLLIVALLLLGLFCGVKWLVSMAYADSFSYGYCLIEDESLWKKINVASDL